MPPEVKANLDERTRNVQSENNGASPTMYGAPTKVEQWNNELMCTRIIFKLRPDG